MDKKVFIIAGVVVVILGAGGAFVFSNKKDVAKSNSSTTQNVETSGPSSDEAKEDLGACAAVDTAVIKQALGTAAANLGAQQNTGVTGLGDGDKGQTCVYPFIEGGTVANSFYLDIASYSSQATFDEVSQFAGGDTSVSGIGDKASFEVSEPLGATNSKEFALTVFKDKKIWKFVISQPSASVTFDDTSAQAALTTIAKSAKL